MIAAARETATPADGRRARWTGLLIALALTLATLGAYWQVLDNGFVDYDDDQYVTDNAQVGAGLTWETARWSFSATHSANWHPLTWLSHALDVTLFGLDPRGHHAVNLALHVLNTLLTLAVLRRMTGALWRSAFVAALFALHPLHVESVAWVAERKDVLSTFFWLTTLWAYARYAERPGLPRYLFVFGCFALGLTAKPMLVTLPFVLLLLDWWPLGRFRRPLPLFLEKLPLLLLSAASCWVTYLVQQSWGAVASLHGWTLPERLANALVSYAVYIAKTVWPANLAVLYPRPESLPAWQLAAAALLLVLLSALALLTARRRPWFCVGWLWFLGTLVPVIGLVQVGSQALADRYTYVPLTGLFIVVAWGLAALAPAWRPRAKVFGLVAVLVLAFLGTATARQVQLWSDNLTLFGHALAVTEDNAVMHGNFGAALLERERYPEAIEHLRAALQLDPGNTQSRGALTTGLYNLGCLLAQGGRQQDAVAHFREALQLDPRYAEAHNNLGVVLAGLRRIPEASEHLSRALEIDPDYADAHNNLGSLLAGQGRLEEAERHFAEALRIDPGSAETRMNLQRVRQRLESP